MRSADMTVEDYATACDEVDSVGIIHGAGSMEIGTATYAGDLGDCNGNQPSGPEFFAVYHTLTGAKAGCCDPCGESVTPWDKEGFGTADQNEDGDWTFWHDGNVVNQSFANNVPFSTGTAVTNAERHGTGDVAWGHFENNYFMTATGWTAWTSAAECGNGSNGARSNDPTFNNQIWSASNITVSTGSSVC